MYVAHHATAEPPAPGSCTPAASTRSRTTSAPTSPCSSWPPTGPVAVRGVVRAGGMLSGGTFHSAMGAFSRARQMREAMQARAQGRAAPGGPLVQGGGRQAAPRPGCSASGWCRCRPSTRSSSRAAAPRSRRTGRGSPTPTTPGTKTLRYAAGGAVGVVRARASPPRCRRCAKFLLGRVKQGDGPDEARRAKSWFTVDFVGEGDGRTVHTRVSRRRPRLRRDRQDARRVRAVPGLRRQPRRPPAASPPPRRWARTSPPGWSRPGSGSRRSGPGLRSCGVQHDGAVRSTLV